MDIALEFAAMSAALPEFTGRMAGHPPAQMQMLLLGALSCHRDDWR